MSALANLLILLSDLYIYVIIAQVIVSWLIAFDVINTKSAQARNLTELLGKATDPVYKPLRKYIPAIGGIDISPIIVIFLIYIFQSIVATVLL